MGIEQIVMGFILFILFLLMLYWENKTDRVGIKIDNLFLSDKVLNTEAERIEIFALNNGSTQDISGNGFIFLNSITTRNGVKYDYLVKSELGMQIKTTQNGEDIHIKEVECSNNPRGFKVRIHKTIRHLVEKEFTESEINRIGKEEFEERLERYEGIVFEVPKGTIKQKFDIDLSK